MKTKLLSLSFSIFIFSYLFSQQITNSDTVVDLKQDSLRQANYKPKMNLYYSGVGRDRYVEWKHTLPALKTDKQAMKHVHISKAMRVVKVVGAVVSFGAVIMMAGGALSDEGETIATGGYIFFPLFTIAMISQFIQIRQIRTAVRIYNKNAGYEYEDGLEKSSRHTDTPYKAKPL